MVDRPATVSVEFARLYVELVQEGWDDDDVEELLVELLSMDGQP